MSLPSTRRYHRDAPRPDPSSRRDRSPGLHQVIFDVVHQWIARSREHRALRDLAERDDPHLLRDIGVTREQALRGGAKWFWQP